ncbi:MAG TPA: DUF817 domain-containing protein [Fimbriimonadaceae bacterium]|nr:DUF817 domain-containing protein [Fimbriimonadaceae bacterium]
MGQSNLVVEELPSAPAPQPPLQKPAPAWKLFLAFAWTELLCCVFPLGVFASLAMSKLVHVPGLPRYDFILICCLLIQWAMVKSKLETVKELKVICVFHLIGLAMELFKTRVGSWSYPEFAYTKVSTAPLYSGFMYASVASYMCQAWRRFDLQMLRMPADWLMLSLAAGIYANFFTNHYIMDFRWFLGAGVFAAFWRTRVGFNLMERRLGMPMSVAFLLIGFFVWIAENIATYFSAWQYPHQVHAWSLVEGQKISSWALLVIISFVLVAWLKRGGQPKRNSARGYPA